MPGAILAVAAQSAGANRRCCRRHWRFHSTLFFLKSAKFFFA